MYNCMYNYMCFTEDWTADGITRRECVRIMVMCEVLGYEHQDVLWNLAKRTFGIERLSSPHA